MDITKLDTLPFDILQQIADYLNDTHRPSLYALGLVSSACQKAALPSVFREVNLTVHGDKALQCHVDTLGKVLSSTESAHHVRHLVIKGFLILDTDESDERGKEARTSNTGSTGDGDDDGDSDDSDEMEFLDGDWLFQHGIAEVLGDEEPYLGMAFFPDENVEVSPEEDFSWAPVVHLVKTLPYLTKLVYDCGNQFPPSLLDALHEHHPQCKLYHLTFRLRSLRNEPYNAHEMAIATSPCLYSVMVRYAWRDSNGEDDFHEDMMPELVASLAPNLKEVRMLELHSSVTRNSQRRRDIERELWRGLPGFIPGHGIGTLTSLSLAGAVRFRPDLLQTWSQSTDLTALNYLALGGGFYDYDCGVNGQVMEWIVQNCSLAQLKTLRIRLDRGDDDELKPTYANDAITFFKALKPLHELSVDGPLEPKIVDAILSQHGRDLRKLSLCPSESRFSQDRLHIPMIFGKEHILQIQAQCPVLQDLSITVKRTKSDAREAEIYKTFGSMERLQVLFLILDCSNWQVTRDSSSADSHSFNQNDREFCRYSNCLRRGHAREIFINCAVDETLARSIWETICQDKVGRQLQSLKLYTTGGKNLGDVNVDSHIQEVVDNLSRSWLIEKGVRDDEDMINVRELGREAREAIDEKHRVLRDKFINRDRAGLAPLYRSEAVQIFRRIWATKEGSRDWREDWASLPLHAGV